MFTRHKLRKTVKQYLLGALDEQGTAWLEQRYFSDPVFFDWVWREEERLIASYLEGRLSAEDSRRFESRYREIPALQKRLEEVRIRLGEARPKKLSMGWQFGLAGALIVAVSISSWIWYRSRPVGPVSTVASVRPQPAPEVLAVHLTPGTRMGSGTQQVQFTPPAGGRVSLMLELPSARSPVPCVFALTMVKDANPRETVWTSPRLLSVAAGNSQEVRLEMDASQLSAADYVGELRAPDDGSILESYSFRVNAAR